MKKIILILLICLIAVPSLAQKKAISTIRDAETERYLHKISDPIFEAAGLSPSSIKIIIVNDPVLNAFVSGGQNMFINTGLITESDDPSMLMGVIAHEAGHIAGGHLIKKMDDAKKSQIEAALGYILGAASVAVGAPPGAAIALMSGGTHVAQRNFLKFSRSHEEVADQMALSFMEKVGIKADGLITLMEKLNKNQNLLYDDVNPYKLTHPLSSERISHLKAAQKVEQERFLTAPLILEHLRIKAKLEAFLGDVDSVLKKYKKNESDKADYARAIAFYRIPNIEKSLSHIDTLIKKYPDDTFYHELKGQILFENGRIEESIISYQKAFDLMPDSPLIHLELASAYLSMAKNEIETEKNARIAINLLEKVVIKEAFNVHAWHQLAIAYGKNNQLGLSYMALAEKAFIYKDAENVEKYIELARKNLGKDSPSQLRVHDLLKALKEMEK